MNKNYVIFDMDGTLVDSMGYWKQLAKEYLLSKGITQVSEEILEAIKPMTMTESAELFIEQFSFEGTAEGIALEINTMMDEHYRRDIPLKFGVREYLEQLHKNGVKMCVASATAESLMEACLKRLGVREFFDFLLSCETVGAGKQKPDVYFEAVRRMGASPNECAVFEDALYAGATAKKAGFYVVAVFDENAEEHWEELTELADEAIKNWMTDCQQNK